MVCETISTAARASARANKLSSKPPNILLGGVGRQARRIASELLLLLLLVLLMMVLLMREDDEQDEADDALEVRVDAEDECSEYLGSGRLCAIAKGCLLFRDIIIIFARVRASASSFNKLRLRLQGSRRCRSPIESSQVDAEKRLVNFSHVFIIIIAISALSFGASHAQVGADHLQLKKKKKSTFHFQKQCKQLK